MCERLTLLGIREVELKSNDVPAHRHQVHKPWQHALSAQARRRAGARYHMRVNWQPLWRFGVT